MIKRFWILFLVLTVCAFMAQGATMRTLQNRNGISRDASNVYRFYAEDHEEIKDKINDGTDFVNTDYLQIAGVTVIDATGAFIGTFTPAGATAKSFVYCNAAGNIVTTAAPTNGQLLVGKTGDIPSLATLTGTANQVVVTNGAGAITLATPQDIATGSSPTFSGLTLSSKTVNGFLYSGAAGAVTSTNAATDGQLLIGDTGSNPLVGTLTAVAHQTTITNAAGSITIGTVQDVDTSSNPSFSSVSGTDAGSFIAGTASAAAGQISFHNAVNAFHGILKASGVTAADKTYELPDLTGTVLVDNSIDASSELLTIIDDETGSGNIVFSTSPTFVTPALGTPASGTLTSCTGLPISTGVSGLAAGVATALATPSSANLITAVTDETGSGALVFATSPTLVTPALGVPASGTLTSCTGLPISTGVSGLAAGVATALATPSSANLITAVTDETGTGSLVFATSPTLVTPALGTPASGTLTSCTGLPISTGVSGLAAGVATALATPSSANLITAVTDETGTGSLVFATSPTLVTPALGTPASGTLTSCTGLPISTGVSGLAANVATALATPSSANLISAVTDETGSGSLVFATSPTLVTPALGTPASGTLTSCTGLPISTGVSGLAANVATALATPSSANVAAAVTDETGTAGSIVFSVAPALTGLPTFGNAAASAGTIKFLEDSDNGANGVTLSGAESTADVTVTLPAIAGTLALVGVDNGAVSFQADAFTGTTMALSTPILTPGAGTGVVISDAGSLRTQVYKVQVGYTNFTSNSTTHDLTIATLPAKSIVHAVLANVTETFVCADTCTTGTLSATVGISAGGTEFLESFDIDAAIAAFGDADAEVGSTLDVAGATNSGYISWAGTAVVMRGTSGTGDFATLGETNLNAGSITFYILYSLLP